MILDYSRSRAMFSFKTDQNNKKSKMDSIRFDCRTCHRDFSTSRVKDRHEKDCFKYVEFLLEKYCMKCEKTYKSIGGAREHVRLVHKEEFYGKVKDIVPDPDSGCKVIIEPLKYCCFPCGKAFDFAWEFELHRSRHHRDFGNVEYLSSLGKSQTATVIKDADIGVANSNRDAECLKAAMDAKFETDTKIEDDTREEDSPAPGVPADQVDPMILSKLFKCPICLGYLATRQQVMLNFDLLHFDEIFFSINALLPIFDLPLQAEYHVARFHQISQQHQIRMGLEIKEHSIENGYLTASM